MQNNIQHGHIEQEPFIDFSTSRNHALDRAQKKFPDAEFIIMLDAEWYLNDAHALLNFCKLCLTRHDMYATYLIRILNKTIDFYTPRLIRCRYNARFEGTVHETISSQTTVKVPSHIYFEYKPTSYGIDKSYNRFIKDRELLYEQHIKNPLDTRTLFYLAKTCQNLGYLTESYNLYKKRIACLNNDEEDFLSLYFLGQVVEQLSSFNVNYTWHEALNYYLRAYEMRPHRAEPLINIAQYYIQQNNLYTASLFAQHAVELPYPHNDVLFIQKYAYDYLRYELLAQCTSQTAHNSPFDQ
jgi:hypothetical protein